MPDLPTHLTIGRNSFPGPVSGGYMFLPFGPFTQAAPGDVDILHVGFPVPCDMRLERVDYRTLTNGVAATTARMFWIVGAVPASPYTGATAVHAAITVDQANTFSVAAEGSPTAAFASSAARDIPRGANVFFVYDYDADSTLTGHSILITAVCLGHANADAQFD